MRGSTTESGGTGRPADVTLASAGPRAEKRPPLSLERWPEADSKFRSSPSRPSRGRLAGLSVPVRRGRLRLALHADLGVLRLLGEGRLLRFRRVVRTVAVAIGERCHVLAHPGA